MNRISTVEKLIIFSLEYVNRPISFVRLVRVIRLADLSTQIIYSNSFNLKWYRVGKEYRSSELSTAMDSLCRKKIVKKLTKNSYILTSPMKVSIDPEWTYGIHAYLNSSYIVCHPKALDKRELELSYQLTMGESTGDLEHFEK